MSTAPPWVDECESLSASRFRRAYFDTGTPVVLRGLIRGWPACATWSLDALARRFPTQTVEVMVCDPDARATGESPYLERRRLPFAAAVALMGEDGGPAPAPGRSEPAVRRPHVRGTVGRPVLGSRLVRSIRDPPGVSLWVSPRHSVTPLHYDLASTLLAQVVGRKRVIFASPADTENLYKGPAGYSTADPEVPARDRYPRLAGARLHQAVLEPGDALFLPHRVVAPVRSLEASISLSLRNFAWSSPLSPV